MKVIDTIQSLHSLIDQLSIHKADTEVVIGTNGGQLLTNVIDVDDCDGIPVVIIHERVTERDDVDDGEHDTLVW